MIFLEEFLGGPNVLTTTKERLLILFNLLECLGGLLGSLHPSPDARSGVTAHLSRAKRKWTDEEQGGWSLSWSTPITV